MTSRLKAIGFWGPVDPLVARPELGPDDPWVKFCAEGRNAEAMCGTPFLPDPRLVIATLGEASVDDRLLAYLDSGHVVGRHMGYSQCRCCGREVVGTCDLSDGEWVWPQGLSHYLREHGLPLPEPVLSTFQDREYQVPLSAPSPPVPDEAWEYDFSFWHDWTESVYARAGRSS